MTDVCQFLLLKKYLNLFTGQRISATLTLALASYQSLYPVMLIVPSAMHLAFLKMQVSTVCWSLWMEKKTLRFKNDVLVLLFCNSPHILVFKQKPANPLSWDLNPKNKEWIRPDHVFVYKRPLASVVCCKSKLKKFLFI